MYNPFVQCAPWLDKPKLQSSSPLQEDRNATVTPNNSFQGIPAYVAPEKTAMSPRRTPPPLLNKFDYQDFASKAVVLPSLDPLSAKGGISRRNHTRLSTLFS